MPILRFFAALLFAFFTAPLAAKWYVAESDHFVIYADDSEKDVREFSQNLERFHAAMELVSGRKVAKPSPSNRVTIFAVGSQRDLRKVAGTSSRTLAGFYLPRAGGSRAFVQDIRNKSGRTSFTTIVLLHEYAHHFFHSSSRFAMPRWLSEGSAEFYASAKFHKDGSVTIGSPAQHRVGELARSDLVTVPELLDPELYAEKRVGGYDSFYGRSWLLYHYLVYSTDRRGQLAEYTRLVASGTPSIDAGKAAFGDLSVLQTEVNRYLRERSMFSLKFAPDKLKTGPITVRRLPEGEAEMMDVRIRSQRGVTREEAIDLLEDAREVAEEYPNDPGVLTALAEAEYDAGNNAEAIAAADKAIAIDPRRTNAYVQKGYALFRAAEDADDKETAYRDAMKPFSTLNGIENDHPLPLIYYFRSFAEQGLPPTENAQHALERAAQLAPFDRGLWMQVGLMQAKDGKIALARYSIEPIAYDPHGGKLSERARTIMSLLENVTEGTIFEPPAEEDDPSNESESKDGEEEGEDG